MLENSSPSVISSNIISQLPLSEAPIRHALGLLTLNCYFICFIFISLGDFPKFYFSFGNSLVMPNHSLRFKNCHNFLFLF